MNLGYACINNFLRRDGIFTGRTCRIKNFSLERVSELVKQNTADLVKIIEWNEQNDVHLFRVSSDIFPFYDHPELRYEIDDLKDAEEIYENLNTADWIARQSKQRLTMHPGPFVCLSSKNPEVRQKAHLTLNMHRDIMQLLGSKDPVINIHVGGNFSKERAKTFCEEVEKLPLSTRKMLSVENDDKPNGFSVRKLWEHVWYFTGVPILIDLHHWKFCYEQTSMEQDFLTSMGTWAHANRKPKIHWSESAQNKKPQAHSELISGPMPGFLPDDLDCMIEAKGKEQALLGYRNATGSKISTKTNP